MDSRPHEAGPAAETVMASLIAPTAARQPSLGPRYRTTMSWYDRPDVIQRLYEPSSLLKRQDPMHANSAAPSFTGGAIPKPAMTFNFDNIERKARKAKDDGIIQRRLNQIQQQEITKSLAKRKSRVGNKGVTPKKAGGTDHTLHGATAEDTVQDTTEGTIEDTTKEVEGGERKSPEWKTLYEEDLFEIRTPKKEYLRDRHNEKRKERRRLKRERGPGALSQHPSLIVKLRLPRDLLPRDLQASPIRKTPFTDRLKNAHLKNTPSTTTNLSRSPSLPKARTEGVECQNLVEPDSENSSMRTTEDEVFPDFGLEGLMTDDALQVHAPHTQDPTSMTRTPTRSFAKAADSPRPQSSSTPHPRSLTLPMRRPTPSIVPTNSNPQANNKQISVQMAHVVTAFPKDNMEFPTMRIVGTTDPNDELLKHKKTKDMYGQTFDCQWRVFAMYNARDALKPEWKPWISGDNWIKDDILIMKAPRNELGDSATRHSHPKLQLSLDRFKDATPNADGSYTYRIPQYFKLMVEIEPLLPSYPPLGLHNLSKLSPTARDCIRHTSSHVNLVRLFARVYYNKDDSGLIESDINTYLADNTEFPHNFPPAKKASEISRLRGEAINNTEHPTPFKLEIEITWPSWCKEPARAELPKDDKEPMTMPEDIATAAGVMKLPDDISQQPSFDEPASALDPAPVANPTHSNTDKRAPAPIAPVPVPHPLELSTAKRYGIVQPPPTSPKVKNTTKKAAGGPIDLTQDNDTPPQRNSAAATKPVEVIDLDDSDNDEEATGEMPNPPNSLAPMSPVKHGHPSSLTSTISRLLSQSDFVEQRQQAQSTLKTTSATPETLQERTSTPLPRSTPLAARNQTTTGQTAPERFRQQTSTPLPRRTSLATTKKATTGQTAAYGASNKEPSSFISSVWMVVDEKNQKTPKTWKDHRCHICNGKFPNFLALRDHLASPENHADRSIRILYDKAGSECDIWARLPLAGKEPLKKKVLKTKVFEEVQDSPESEEAWRWLPPLPLPPASVTAGKVVAATSTQHPAGINSTSEAAEVPLRMDIVAPSEEELNKAAMKPVSPDYQRLPRLLPRNPGVPMNWNMNIVHDPVTRQPLGRDASVPQYPQPEATSHFLQAHVDLTHRSKDFSDDDKDFVVVWDLFITAKQGRGTMNSSLPKTIKQFVCANWVWLYQRPSRVPCYLKQITALETAKRISPAAGLEAAMLLKPPVVPKEAWNRVEQGCKWTTPEMLEQNKKNWTALWGSLRWQMERSGGEFTTAMDITYDQFVNVAGHLLIERGQEDLKTKATNILRNIINTPDGMPDGKTKYRDLTASDVIEMLHDMVEKKQHPEWDNYLRAYNRALAGKIVMEPGDEETDERMKRLKDYMLQHANNWHWRRYHVVELYMFWLSGKLSSKALIRHIGYFDKVGNLTDPEASPNSQPLVVKPPVLKPASLPNVPPEAKRFPIPKPPNMRGRLECKCGIDVVPWNIVHCANQHSKRHKCPQPNYHRLCTDAGPARTKDGSPTEEVWFCEECKKKGWDRAESVDDGGDSSDDDDDDAGGPSQQDFPGSGASHDGTRPGAPDTMRKQREKSPNPQPRKKPKMTSKSNDETTSGAAVMQTPGTNLASLTFHAPATVPRVPDDAPAAEEEGAKRQATGSLGGTGPKRPRIEEPAPIEDPGSILSPGSVSDTASPGVPKSAKKDGGPCRRCGRTKCTGWNKKLTGEEPPEDGKVWCFNCYHSDWRKKKAAKEKAEAEEAKRKAHAVRDVLSPAQGGFAAHTEADLKREKDTVRQMLEKERRKYWEMTDDDASEEAMKAKKVIIDGLAAKHKQLQAAMNTSAEGAASVRGM